jgi:hypothetical protein
MRKLGFAVLLLTISPCVAHGGGVTTIKVRIDAPELDKALLLDKLNSHGADHHLRFEKADQGFDYRIEFDTFQHRNTAATLAGAGAVHFSGAEAKVYDSRGNLLFDFTRETRYTDAGAANATAKEIIKRLLRWRAEQAKGASKDSGR